MVCGDSCMGLDKTASASEENHGGVSGSPHAPSSSARACGPLNSARCDWFSECFRCCSLVWRWLDVYKRRGRSNVLWNQVRCNQVLPSQVLPSAFLPLGGHLQIHCWHSHAPERTCCSCSLQGSFSSSGRQTSGIVGFFQEHWSWGPCQTGTWTTAKGCDTSLGPEKASGFPPSRARSHHPFWLWGMLLHMTWPSNMLYLGRLPSLFASSCPQ